ncbi:MAG: transcriptional regulator [Alishewanella sp. 34-51-39]|nr:MAG: transcriptional regulator [Alishewanella sp. 34-51-39]
MIEISDAELTVMQILWQQHPSTAAEVIARLQHKDWHEKTIKTLLNRLVSKGALSYQKQGKAYLYSPAIDCSLYQQQASSSFIKKLFSGQLTPLVASFTARHQVSATDLAALKELVNRLEQDKDNG